MKQRRLTHKEKTELFTKYESGKYTGVDLAKEYPISLTAINGLLRRNGMSGLAYGGVGVSQTDEVGTIEGHSLRS